MRPDARRRTVRIPLRAVVFALIGALGAAPALAADPAPTSPEARARRILQAAGISQRDPNGQGGLVVHLGCGEGRLTAALHASDATLVHGLDTDPAHVETARAHIRSMGLYGPVSAGHLEGRRLPYTANLVNLVVADDLGGVPMDEVRRVLAPGGVAWVAGKTTVKPRPDDIDDWTHYLHGPDNNATARDRRVGPPRHLKWKSGPMWCRSHNGVPSSVAVVLSANGRLVSLIDQGLTGQPGLPERWTLVARDAFNGVRLWERPLGGRVAQKAIAAVGDRVFLTVARRDPVSALDAATGETVHTYEGTDGADELVCIDGTVVVHVGGPRKGGKDDTILALEADTGRIRWRTPAKHIARNSLAAHGNRVCYRTLQEAVCLDLDTGQEVWRTPCKGGQRRGALMIYGGAVLATAPGGLRAFALDTGKPLWTGPGVHRRLGMFGAGGLVWITRIHEHGRTFLWTPAPVTAEGYDPRTGRARRTVEVRYLITPGHHIRCYPAKATERYLLLPKRGVEFVDLESSNHMRHNWLRAPCGHGVMAANGLLYMPPHQCFCYPGVKLTGFQALSADVGEDAPTPEAPEKRLERGPAYGQIGNRKSETGPRPAEISNRKSQTAEPAGGAPRRNPKSEMRNDVDWPTYRHDARRSGRAGARLPVHLADAWHRDLGGALSPPVLADGRLLVAEKDAHTLHCLDAETGKRLWHHTAGGRIDSPPTLYRGLVLFGSADGRVACLRAADGELVWRFRAAPADRRIVAFDQLESAWPVHGNVLVLEPADAAGEGGQDGVAYCTAGRSSYLDGGMWLYALDPATGSVLHQRHLQSPPPDLDEDAGRPFDMDGARSDLLVSDGTDLYLFFRRFGPDLEETPTPRITKLGDRRVGLHLMSNAGFLDTSWFDRNYWTYSRRWPGFYFAYHGPKAGQILVFDDQTTYGLHVFTQRQGHSPRFWPGKDGYELFADSNEAEPVLRPSAIGREKGHGYTRTRLPRWSVQVPVRFRAMVLAGDRLYAAGPPDVVPQDDPYAAFEGRKGGRLWVVSTADGRRLAEVALEAPPVFDGLAAARGRLYLATADGRLTCMAGKK